MKKILVLVPSLNIGGRERIAVNTVQCLRPDYEVETVVFQRGEKEYACPGEINNLNLPPVRFKPMKFFRQMQRMFRLARLCRKKKTECVFSLGAAANLTNVLAKKLTGCRAVSAIHGFAEVKRNRQNSYIFHHSDVLVCISQEMQYQLLKLYPDLTNTVVIENGYDTEEQLNGRRNTREFDPEAPRFAAMGRLNSVKGYDRLIRAFALIRKEIPGATLSFIGEGELENDLKELARAEGVEDGVFFCGYTSAPLDKLLELDLFCLTSHNEGFPNALIEAMACGLCVVAVDCLSGPREILSETYSPEPVKGIRCEKYGVLVENSSDEDEFVRLYAEAAVSAARDIGLRKRYRALGPERCGDFSLKRYDSRIRGLLEGLPEKESRN